MTETYPHQQTRQARRLASWSHLEGCRTKSRPLQGFRLAFHYPTLGSCPLFWVPVSLFCRVHPSTCAFLSPWPAGRTLPPGEPSGDYPGRGGTLITSESCPRAGKYGLSEGRIPQGVGSVCERSREIASPLGINRRLPVSRSNRAPIPCWKPGPYAGRASTSTLSDIVT